METHNISKQKYTPINGEFYEKLESAATLNYRCELTYLDEEGSEHDVITQIHDLYTHDHVEYAILDDDRTIRLDQIKSLNGEIEPHFRKNFNPEDDFSKRFYSTEVPALIGQNDYYKLTVDRERKLVELSVFERWDTLDDIPDLKSQLIKIADYLEDKFGFLNDLTELLPDEEGVLIAPFIPARGILINAGLERVSDLIPNSCTTLVHDRGSFSVNSLKVRSFKERFAAENYATDI